MKFSRIFQFIIILGFLIIWNALHVGYSYQKDKYHTALSQNPVLIFSRNNETLDSISVKTSELEYIRKTIIETDSLISSNLIETYDLYYAKNIISSFKLPAVMKVYFHGELYDLSAKTHFEDILKESEDNIDYHFDEGTWKFYQDRLNLVDKLYLYGNLVYILFFLFITVFLRIHFEIRDDHYWRVYVKAGGRMAVRRKHFVLSSLLISLLPFLLVFLAVHLAHFFGYIHFYVDLRVFAVELAVLIFGCAISVLILGDRTK